MLGEFNGFCSRSPMDYFIILLLAVTYHFSKVIYIYIYIYSPTSYFISVACSFLSVNIKDISINEKLFEVILSYNQFILYHNKKNSRIKKITLMKIG